METSRRKWSTGIAAIALLVFFGCVPLRASSFGFDAMPAGFWMESSSIDIPADFGSEFSNGHASLFSGYLLSWPGSLPLPDNPGQVLVQNLIQSLTGDLGGYSGSEIAGVAASFFDDRFGTSVIGSSGAYFYATQTSMAQEAVFGPMQPFSVFAAEPAPASVPEPGPATLVFLGCCFVALCVALANRSTRPGDKLAENAGTGAWPQV